MHQRETGDALRFPRDVRTAGGRRSDVGCHLVWRHLRSEKDFLCRRYLQDSGVPAHRWRTSAVVRLHPHSHLADELLHYGKRLSHVPRRVSTFHRECPCAGGGPRHGPRSAGAGYRDSDGTLPQRRCRRRKDREPLSDMRLFFALLLTTAVWAQTGAEFSTGLLRNPDMPQLELMLANRPAGVIARRERVATLTA